ncbi:MAG TPA: sugar phosphate isomerase/epimerase [Chthonomonadaceae bacterium]|nr:sugar phosphate isomerase/epimerase [Chthonomonadaceae bacterium]
MKISIASYSFHGLLAEGKIDAFGYLESCKYRYGLDSADFWNGLIGTTDEAYLRKVRQEVEAREMTVANYHADGPHLWEDDPEARERNYQSALVHLRAAALLGAQTVRFDTGGAVGPMTTEQFDYLVARYQEYCRFANDHGFRVGPENHWGLSLIAENMEQLARAVDSPAYGILLHIGHWEDGDEEGGDRRLAPWTMHTHIDARITRTCLAERMKLLLEAGYSGYWGVEHHSAQNEYAEVGYQLAEVRRVLARWQWETHNTETIEALQGKPGNPLLTLEQEGLN